jgi:hypothetical protein
MSRPQEPAARTDDVPFALKWGLSANQADVLRQRKYSVMHGNSDWVIGTADQEMQIELFCRMASDVCETEALSRPENRQLAGRTKSRGQQ